MELLTPSDSSLWKHFSEKLKLQQMDDWNPKIKMMENVSNLDFNTIYVMKDPDYSKSKTDVVFFAKSIHSSETVRVLCQLTTQVKADTTSKAKESFIAMFGLKDDGIPDYRLYLAPKSSVNFPPVHSQQFSSGNCFWLDSSSFSPMLKFSMNLCDPTKATEALTELMNFAISIDDESLADKISDFIPGSCTKRKRESGMFLFGYNGLFVTIF